MFNLFEDIFNQSIKWTGKVIGYSRGQKAIHALSIGTGENAVSLIGGCHADEPVGPLFLRRFCNYLENLSSDHFLLKNFNWWIVPHANPDGEIINQKWYDDNDDEYDIIKYLKYRVRELPGDDIEFGFPKESHCSGLRPENKALYDFWQSAGKDFWLHASLHGTMKAAGPWFLIEHSWQNRSESIQEKCKLQVSKMGYKLHDYNRHGEKGFHRISEGFCSRPDSISMRNHFLELGDNQMADKFYPSSMETIRQMSSDALTIVSEMPLFILPHLEKCDDWPHPHWQEWSDKINRWKLLVNDNEEQVRSEITSSGIKAMPVKDQMTLQWRYITAALEEVSD